MNRDLFEFDGFLVDVRNRTIVREGSPVRLPPKAFDALVMLLRAAPDAVEKSELLGALWGSTVVEDSALAQTVYLVRKALGNRPDQTPYLETVPKRGYRFNCPVNTPDRRSPVPQPRRTRRVTWIAAAAVAVLLAVVGVAVWQVKAAHRAVDPEAARLYRLAMAMWRQRRGGNLTDEKDLRHAIRLQPSFARAHAGLAAVLATRGPTAVSEAKAEVERALNLDPSLGEAHAVQGFIRLFCDWDWTGAGRSLETAVKLDPYDAMAAQWYGMYLALRGRIAEAEQVFSDALARHPESANLWDEHCQVLYWARRYAEAAQSCEQALRLNPGFLFACGHAAMVYAALGQYDSAGIMAAREIFEHAGQSQTGEWQKKFQRAVTQAGARGFYETQCSAWTATGDFAFGKALCQAALGEKQAVLDSLERCLNTRSFHSVFVPMEPLFDGLRGDPRFEELCRRLRVRDR